MKQLHPLAVLVGSVAVITAFQVAYVAIWVNPSPAAAPLLSIALALAFVHWVEADVRRRSGLPCHDFGFLIAVYFPASLLWYAVWSRGWRGLVTFLGLLGLMLVPWLSTIVACLLLYGDASP
ncbi:MAG: hypothetical protein U0800_22085 [Isosphaeraceae bacterium]